MSGILNDYTIMQQNEWAARRFFTAQSHRTGQVVYLIAAPVQDPVAPYQHPSLPRVEPLALEGPTRWLAGGVPEGDTLEDLRNRGTLTESDLVGGLLSVLDGMLSLSQLEPPPVPTYLDPACIKRDRLGRWTLDYLALAHAPEARSSGSSPPGAYAFGVLLYWLITGETVRRSRVQVHRIAGGTSTGLQYIVVKCLSKSYLALAELRADIEQAGRDRDFRRMLQRTTAQPAATPANVPVITQTEAPMRPPELEHHRIKLGGPQIPMNDRPWALPPRPAEGYRKYVVPPPPNPLVARATRWGALGLVAVATMALATAVFVKAGLIPPDLLPWRSQPATVRMPDSTQPGMPIAPSTPPAAPVTGPIAGPPVPKSEVPATNVAQQPPAPAAQPQPKPQQPPAKTTPPPPSTRPGGGPKQPPAPPPAPAPVPPAQPVAPAHPEPAPGSEDYLDASQGGLPVHIYANNAEVGWAWIFPHPAAPYISIRTFNRLFGRNILWVPVDGGAIRLLNGSQNLITSDYELVRDRLWLRLTPFLQEALGVKVTAYDEAGMHFSLIVP